MMMMMFLSWFMIYDYDYDDGDPAVYIISPNSQQSENQGDHSCIRWPVQQCCLEADMWRRVGKFWQGSGDWVFSCCNLPILWWLVITMLLRTFYVRGFHNDYNTISISKIWVIITVCLLVRIIVILKVCLYGSNIVICWSVGNMEWPPWGIQCESFASWRWAGEALARAYRHLSSEFFQGPKWLGLVG